MKTFYTIYFDNGDSKEGYGLEATLEKLAFHLNEHDVYDVVYPTLDAIWYEDANDKEIYLSEQGLDQAQGFIETMCDEVIAEVIENAQHQEELRRDYYAGQL